MKNLSLLLLLAVLSLVNCEKQPEKYQYGFSEADKANLILGLILKPNLQTTDYGTVRDPSSRLEWKRCVQGQQFRTGINDCKGVSGGTLYTPVDITFGASTLTFCNIPGNDCNSLTIPNVLTRTNTTSEAFNSCNSERTNSFEDWRVPTIVELKTIGVVGKIIIYEFFSDAPDSDYWSSNSNELDQSGLTARTMNFGVNYGQEGLDAKDKKHYVRCVRSY
jgi:hypothetical protein